MNLPLFSFENTVRTKVAFAVFRYVNKKKTVTQNLLAIAENPIRFGKNPKSPGLLRIKIVKHL